MALGPRAGQCHHPPRGPSHSRRQASAQTLGSRLQRLRSAAVKAAVAAKCQVPIFGAMAVLANNGLLALAWRRVKALAALAQSALRGWQCLHSGLALAALSSAGSSGLARNWCSRRRPQVAPEVVGACSSASASASERRSSTGGRSMSELPAVAAQGHRSLGSHPGSPNTRRLTLRSGLVTGKRTSGLRGRRSYHRPRGPSAFPSSAPQLKTLAARETFPRSTASSQLPCFGISTATAAAGAQRGNSSVLLLYFESRGPPVCNWVVPPGSASSRASPPPFAISLVAFLHWQPACGRDPSRSSPTYRLLALSRPFSPFVLQLHGGRFLAHGPASSLARAGVVPAGS